MLVTVCASTSGWRNGIRAAVPSPIRVVTAPSTVSVVSAS